MVSRPSRACGAVCRGGAAAARRRAEGRHHAARRSDRPRSPRHPRVPGGSPGVAQHLGLDGEGRSSGRRPSVGVDGSHRDLLRGGPRRAVPARVDAGDGSGARLRPGSPPPSRPSPRRPSGSRGVDRRDPPRRRPDDLGATRARRARLHGGRRRLRRSVRRELQRPRRREHGRRGGGPRALRADRARRRLPRPRRVARSGTAGRALVIAARRGGPDRALRRRRGRRRHRAVAVSHRGTVLRGLRRRGLDDHGGHGGRARSGGRATPRDHRGSAGAARADRRRARRPPPRGLRELAHRGLAIGDVRHTVPPRLRGDRAACMLLHTGGARRAGRRDRRCDRNGAARRRPRPARPRRPGGVRGRPRLAIPAQRSRAGRSHDRPAGPPDRARWPAAPDLRGPVARA